MSSNSPVPVPRTGVPFGIADPVVQARAELKATLAAIEEKANVPRRVSKTVDRSLVQARDFTQRNPAISAATVVAGAAAVGLLVWSLVRAYTR